MVQAQDVGADDFERRFGGLRRLYGSAGADHLFAAHAVVVGLGGVGSWAAECLARSGLASLTLVDMDHVSVSNVNRQIQALDATLGQSKVEAMRQRIQQINPAAQVDAVDDFVTPQNWESLAEPWLREGQALAVIDACDQVQAKTAMAAWAAAQGALFVTVGAAGGKRLAHKVEVGDLSQTTHDPLLAQLRYRLRKHHDLARTGQLGVTCVFSREAVAVPDVTCALPGETDGTLNCHGYGSSAAVTATFGMCAAGWVLDRLASGAGFFKKKSASSKSQKNDAII